MRLCREQEEPGWFKNLKNLKIHEETGWKIYFKDMLSITKALPVCQSDLNAGGHHCLKMNWLMVKTFIPN
jgi:hypothetical protein